MVDREQIAVRALAQVRGQLACRAVHRLGATHDEVEEVAGVVVTEALVLEGCRRPLSGGLLWRLLIRRVADLRRALYGRRGRKVRLVSNERFDVAAPIADELPPDLAARLFSLTSRLTPHQREILAACQRAPSFAKAAETLGLSKKTIYTTLWVIRQKLSANPRARRRYDA